MSEWQPARIRDVHKQWTPPEGMVQVYEQTTFKVRRSNSPYTKVSGCRGVAVIEQEQLDEVNPCNDGTFRLCEHEILTD